MSRMRAPGWLADLAIAAVLTTVQAILVAPLFTGSFTRWRQSIEAAFIADARFIVEHFPDLSWDPYWYLGFPFELFYTPLLQAVTAVLGWVGGDIPAAYRIAAAAGLSLGAAGLYVFARSLSLSRAASVLASALFCCAPLASYLLPGLVADGAAVTGSAVPLPWRLVVLVEYGEGPHVLGLTLTLFAAAAVVSYLARPGGVRFWTAALLLVAVSLTNLIAILGAAVLAAMAVLAVPGGRDRIKRGALLAGAVGVLSLVWYSPGFVRAVAGFSTPGGEGGGGYGYLAFPLVVLAAALAGRFGLFFFPARDALPRPDHGLRPGAAILLSSGIVFAGILVAWYVAQVPIAPQPIRYALELDAVVAVGIALTVELLAAAVFARVRGRGAAAVARGVLVAGVAVLAFVVSLPGWSAIGPRISPDPAWEEWSERKVALWLRDHLGPGERAFLSGSHAFWANVFADVPQVRGGVDFAGVTPWWAHSTYQITTGSDPRVSALWLRALGVRYAVVTGPDSRDAYRDFVRPDMFEGVLPVATVIDGARVYESPTAHAAPLLIEFRADPAQPRDALDRATLERYVAALDAGAAGARLTLRQTGLGAWEGEVAAPGPVTLLLRSAHDSGWRAYLDGRPAVTRPDSLGLLAVDIPGGTWPLRIDHRVHTDLVLGNAFAFAGLAFLALRRALRIPAALRMAPAATIVGTVLLYAVALGVVVGYPKGTDAPMHLARLRFVADWFPAHDWLYAWAGGMPMFDSYPALPYLAAIPFVRVFGQQAALEAIALLSFLGLGLGLYGHLVERGRPHAVALTASLMAVTSLALWAWIVNGGVYARPVAIGIGAIAWWTHARALRTGGAGWWAATAALLAAAVASHQYMGAVPALYVAAVHLSDRGIRGIPRLAAVAGTSLLLAAPAIVPALGAVGQGFLGREREHIVSPPDVLLSPIHVGFAAFLVPLALIVLELPRRPVRALAGAAVLGLVTLYVFAPSFGIPSRLYYVAGVDPFTMTYGVALIGALVFAALAPGEGRRARVTIGMAALAIGLNVVLAVPSYAAQRTYPQIVDTSAPTAHERIARETLVVDGDDLSHRILPFTALEAVWFTDAYRKPMLRDYFDQGQIDRDWIAWAFDTAYTPPLSPQRVRALQHWYALDSITILPGQPAERELASVPGVALLGSTASALFHQYSLPDPSAIAVTSTAPIVVVVGDRLDYDRIARLLFDDGTTPSTRIPVWWSGTMADLPDDLAHRAAAVVIVGDRLGAISAAGTRATLIARRGGRVVWDLAGVPDGPLPSPWPNAAVRAVPIEAFTVADRSGRIAVRDFSPARYGDAPWGAQVLAGVDASVTTELALGADALIASVRTGDGALTAVGGNLFFHALTYANSVERGYLLSFLGPPAEGASRDAARYFVDPETRVIETDGAAVVLKESIHPGWAASWRGADGSERPLPVRYTGPALMLVLPPGQGTVTFRYGGSPAGTAGLILAALGALALAGMAAGGRFPRLRRPLSGR